MASVNKVILVGNVGRDPEIVKGNGDYPLANLSLATTSTRKDRTNGELIEETEWHRLVVFGRQAEIVRDYVRKGTQLYVEGSIKTQRWKDKETGAERSAVSINVMTFQMLGGGGNAQRQPSGQNGQGQRAQAQRPQPQRQGNNNAYNQAKQGEQQEMLDDPIPF